MNTMRQLHSARILHDGRLPGGLGAVVLARRLRDQGHHVEVRHLLPGHNARKFWTELINDLIDEGDAAVHLVLFGITYYDLEEGVAGEAIRRLKEAYGQISIWSHRWPDGYSQHTDSVAIPPHDIVYGEFGIALTPAEKLLLLLSVCAARAVPVDRRQRELQLCDALSQWVAIDCNWDRLVNETDLASLLHEVEEDRQPATIFDAGIRVIDVGDNGVIDVEIDAELASFEIPIIDSIVIDRNLPPSTVFLAWLGNERVLLCRRDAAQALPSLRWLVDNRYYDSIPELLRTLIYGPQDAVYFRLPAGTDQSTLRTPMRRLAARLVASATGGRYLVAAVARQIAELANQAFASVDLRGLFTRPSDGLPQLEVVASDLYELIHTSSRTGSPRRTLTIPVKARGPEAVAFIFTHGGYNFQKAERLLEGAVMGLRSSHLSWLGMPLPPGRLRIDIQPDLEAGPQSRDMVAVRRFLQKPLMKSELASGLVMDASVIGTFLRELNMDRLVTFADSETIGPSVAHAITINEVAKLAKVGDRNVAVLDLFAGSGVAHKLLDRQGFRVVSVDLYVSASDVSLDDSNGIWLRADARNVLDPDAPLIEQDFDVIGLDPPHSELLELLFGAEDNMESLVKLCSRRSKLLVLYQGHSTQRGRLGLIEDGLREAGWSRVALLQVEEEIIVVAANDWAESTFLSLIDRTIANVKQFFEAIGLKGVHVGKLNPHL